MLYNKNKVRKTNDKKVLHKVGKQWKVVSVALLMAIGGGVAVANTPSANASSTAIKDGRVTSISSRLPTPPRNTKANLLQNNNENSNAQNVQSQSSQSATNVAQQNTTSNENSSTPSTEAELIQSLDAVPNIQGLQNGSNASVSSNTQSNGSTSEASTSTTQSYLSGDYGSAASYHAKAETLSQVVQSQSTMVQKYTNSLNAKFPTQMKSLNDATSNAGQQLNKDQSASVEMNKIASASNRNSAISEAAQANNQTVSDFVQSITDATTYNSANTSNASNYASYANAVKSDAQLIHDIRTNPSVSANYRFKSALASANYIVASNKANDAQQLANHDSAELNEATNASLSALTLNTNDQIALINSQADSLTVHSLATQLCYKNNDTITKLGIQSVADTKGAISNGTVELRTASGATSQVDVSKTSNLAQVLSDTNVMDNYQSELAKLANFANITSISAQASSANSAVAVANTELNSAKSASEAATKLASNPDFSDILYINLGTNEVGQSAENSINAVISSLSNTKTSDDNAITSAKNADSSTDNNQSLTAQQSSAMQNLQNAASSANSALTSAQTVSGTISANGALLNNNFATTSGLVSLFPGDSIINTDLEAMETNEANSSAENSAITKLSNDVTSLDNSYANDSSSASAYANNADVMLVEAPSTVASLNSDIKNDQAKVASASNAVAEFNNTNAPSDFASLKANLAKASSDLTNDSALATAYATHVYNYAPKYITNMHRMALHLHTNFDLDNSNSHLQMIPKGSHLQVLGVGFARDGMARYVVDFNGQRGFVTASKAFNSPEYLMQTGQHAKFNVLKNAVLYDSKTGTKPVGKVHAGQTVSGTVYAEPDSNFNGKTVYGAYTRIKLDNGDYLTANTSYVDMAQVDVSVTPKSTNTKANKTDNTTPSNVNQIGFINF